MNKLIIIQFFLFLKCIIFDEQFFSCIIDKQQYSSNYSRFLDDGSYINEVRTFIEIANFQNGFNDDGEFILLTAGAIS